jgi:glycosyltransferase involved in cell wall biosynthesis
MKILPISIVLPTLNEAKNIQKLIPEIEKELTFLHPSEFEILIVDDNSEDDTELVIENLKKQYKNIRLIIRKDEGSLPMSIFEGIKNSKFEAVMWLDADGSMDSKSVKKLILKFNENQSSVIIGSRFIKGGGYKGIQKNGKNSFVKSIFNVQKSNDSVWGMIFSMLLNKFLIFYLSSQIKDITSGFIIGKKIHFQNKDIFSRSSYGEYFIYLVNELSLKGVKMIEVGYICVTRNFGESKTANSLRQLLNRGIPYIEAVVMCKREQNDHQR